MQHCVLAYGYFWTFYEPLLVFPGGSDGKSVCLQGGRPGFYPWVGKVPWRRKWQPSSVLFPGKSNGWKSLVGYHPWGLKESDTTEWLHSLSILHECVLSHFSHVWLFVTPWTVAHQPSLSMGFSRQEFSSELPCPSPGDLPDPEIKLASLTSPALAGGFFTTSTTWEALTWENIRKFTHLSNDVRKCCSVWQWIVLFSLHLKVYLPL